MAHSSSPFAAKIANATAKRCEAASDSSVRRQLRGSSEPPDSAVAAARSVSAVREITPSIRRPLSIARKRVAASRFERFTWADSSDANNAMSPSGSNAIIRMMSILMPVDRRPKGELARWGKALMSRDRGCREPQSSLLSKSSIPAGTSSPIVRS